MRALILAGGRATRLRPLTLTTPKAMTPLLGRPFLEHVLAWLRGHGVEEITLLLGFLPDPIRAHFGDGRSFGVRLNYVTEDEPLGSGGAIKQLEAELTAPFFALNGDIFTDLNLRAMTRAHESAGAELTISLVRVDDPSSYGVAAVDGAGWIERFVEKPKPEEAPSDLVNAGTWLFDPVAVTRIPAGGFSMVERELFPDLARERRLLGHAAPCYWMDAGTPERYLQLHRDLLEGRTSSPLTILERPGWHGLVVQGPGGAPGTRGAPPVVDPEGVVEGAVVLGAGGRVGARARIIGPASLGDNIVLQDGAVVEDSVLWDGCRIGPGTSVSGSVFATGCVIGAGARVERSVLGDGVHVRPGAVLHDASVEPGETVGET